MDKTAEKEGLFCKNYLILIFFQNIELFFFVFEADIMAKYEALECEIDALDNDSEEVCFNMNMICFCFFKKVKFLKKKKKSFMLY